MGLLEKIARKLAPGLKDEEQIRVIVAEEIKQAKMALPVTANWDPNNEGYRHMGGAVSQRRDLTQVNIVRMQEVAYFMWDSSAMTRRLAVMDQSFIFGEPFSITSENDRIKELLERFQERNELDLKFPDKIMWMSILGEQCWPVTVNKMNGDVRLKYVDPVNIKQVHVLRDDVEKAAMVEMNSFGGRPGKKYPVIRPDYNGMSKTFERMIGECFFWSINHPPNDPRGRSDFWTLFDWIDGLERYGFNYLERAEFLLNFVWDVLLKGMTEDQISEWLQKNPPPEPGSMRAHNENVEWNAVAPDLKAVDADKGFEMGKGFIMGAAGRPSSWFGTGGKSYQTEAEQFGQVPMKDLDRRQLFCKRILEKMCQFQIDQAVIHGKLTETDAEDGFDVIMPEISKKDLTKLVNGVPQLATALSIAEDKQWITHEDAIQLFAVVVGQLGLEIDVEEAMKVEQDKPEEGEMEDYI